MLLVSDQPPTSNEFLRLRILKHPYFENCKSIAPTPATLKEVVLESMPEGRPLDTKKEDRKH